MARLRPAKPTAGGFTLLEMALVIGLLGIILAVAVPSYASFMARQQLRTVADQLVQDLSQAREASLHRSQRVFASFKPGKSWCWGISSALPCDCQGGVPACDISRQDGREFPRVSLEAARVLEFEPGMGRLVAVGETRFGTGQGHSLSVSTSLMGRAHVCGPDAAQPKPC